MLILNWSSRQNFQKYNQKYWIIYLEKRFTNWKNQTFFYQSEQYTFNQFWLSVLILNLSSRQKNQKYTQKYWRKQLEKRFIDWKNQNFFNHSEQFTFKLNSVNRVYFKLIKPSKFSKIQSKILNNTTRKTFYWLKKPNFLQP